MFKKTATANSYVGYGSVTHSVIDTRKRQRHPIIKVLSVISLAILVIGVIGFGGSRSIDYIQRSQIKIAKASPVEEFSVSSNTGSKEVSKGDDNAGMQRGTVTRIPRTDAVAASSATTPAEANKLLNGTQICPDYPKMPDATCVGVPKGVVFTPASSMVITKDSTIINSQDIQGSIIIKANDVTIINSVIHGAGTGNGVTVESGTVKVIDSEIYGFENGVVGDNWRIYHVNIHSMTKSGAKVGSYVKLEESWIHGMASANKAANGVLVESGITNTIIRHNNIDLSGEPNINAAIYISPELGPNSKGPVSLDKNLLGGGSYSLYVIDGGVSKYVIQNISLLDNRFSRVYGQGPIKITMPVTQTGSTWNDNGQAVVI